MLSKLSKEQLQTIEKEALHLLEKLGMSGDVKIEQAGDGEPTVRVSATVEEPQMFIGEKGQTLFEIQHILKLMVRKKIAEPFYLSLDINEYKKNKEEYLQDLAKTTADEVALLKKPKELSPMPSAERRIVHLALAGRTDVVSESVGEGVDRRVVVKLSGT